MDAHPADQRGVRLLMNCDWGIRDYFIHPSKMFDRRQQERRWDARTMGTFLVAFRRDNRSWKFLSRIDAHEAGTDSIKLERRAGIEPANTGFADLRVSRFATGAIGNFCWMPRSHRWVLGLFRNLPPGSWKDVAEVGVAGEVVRCPHGSAADTAAQTTTPRATHRSDSEPVPRFPSFHAAQNTSSRKDSTQVQTS